MSWVLTLKLLDIATLLLAVIVVTEAPAYAYVDPGTGGMLLQFLTGGVAGVLVLLRLTWSSLRGKKEDPLPPVGADRPNDTDAAEHDPV